MSSGKSASAIAKDRGWPSPSLDQRDPARRYVSGVERRLTPELLDEVREFIEEEHGRFSVRTAAVRPTFSRTCSRKATRFLRLRSLVIRTMPEVRVVVGHDVYLEVITNYMMSLISRQRG